MENLQELIGLYSTMEPCARDIILQMSRKYQKEWPAKKTVALRLVPMANGVEFRLNVVNDMVDRDAPSWSGKPVDDQ